MAVRTAIVRGVLALLGVTAAILGCDRGAPKALDNEARPAAASPAASPAEAPFPPAANEVGLPDDLRMMRFTPFTGDLDGMIERRMVRIGVPYNRTFYFVDKGAQRGVAYELGKAFEEQLNRRLNTTDATKVHVVFMPLPRDRLAAALAEGRIDVVAAQVTVRPELQAQVDFSNPTRTNVSEVVVTGPGAAPVASADDLSGQQVWVRRDSKYHHSLVALNGRLKAHGRAPVVIRDAPVNLEDEDLLEMVNAGLIPITIVDNYLAQFWKQILPNLAVHEAATLRTGGVLGLAMRHDSPQLAAALNAFIAKFGLGTAFGNVIEQRYLVSTKYVKDATSEAERAKFLQMAELFRKYSDEYDVDYLLMAAQGFQESQLNQNAKSAVGAVGVMQIMPATGAEQKVGDIRQLEPNIHAGVKYMRFMIDRYYKDQPMDDLNKALFSFASYNAGPGRVRELRREAQARGLDPNVWFGNVEQIASERVGQETVSYVANIYKYYVAYQLVVERRAQRAAASQSLKAQALK